MKSIKTGADKLIELITQKKKITLDDAAKQLGVGTNVLQEWAEFLEQENLITIEYKFSKAWLVEKKISRDDVVLTAKEITSEKDAFIRKIDVAIKALDLETVGFEQIKKHFTDIQSHIKSEMETVKTELEDLEKYETLKKGLDKEIEQQRQYFQELTEKYIMEIKQEDKKYALLLAEITKERNNIGLSEEKIGVFRKAKEELELSIKKARLEFDNIEKTLQAEEKNLASSEERLRNLINTTKNVESQVKEKQTRNIMEAVKEIETKRDAILKKDDELLVKVKQKAAQIQHYSDSSKKVFESFKGFFMKKIMAQEQINQIDNERKTLIDELEGLRGRIEKFSILERHPALVNQIKEIEGKISEIEHKRIGLKAKIDKLIDLIKG